MKSQVLCPVCGNQSLTAGTHDLGLVWADRKIQVSNLEHYDCSVCGADPAFPEQIRRNDLKIADAKRRVQGLLTAAEIREIREDLGLSQADAAALFGGGANAFSKYERGEVIQSVPMDRLLRVVSAYPFVATALRTDHFEVGAHWGTTSVSTSPLYFTPEEVRPSGARDRARLAVDRDSWVVSAVPS
jgi:HTH-type transcriptional regulator / antitoxin MqsA